MALVTRTVVDAITYDESVTPLFSGLLNPSFEAVGTAPGLADGWSFTRLATIEVYLAFDETAAPREDFDSEWQHADPSTLDPTKPFNEDSLFAFVDATHLEAAQFAGIDREEFEFGWDNDAGFLDDLDALTPDSAEFDALAFISSTVTAPYTLAVGHQLSITTEAGGPASSDAIAAAVATAAGAGGSFPTGFVGGERVLITLDEGTAQVVTFQAADQTALQVRDRINTFLPGAAVENGGEVDISGTIQGTDGSVALADVDVGTLAVIGHTAGTTQGTGNVADLAAGVTAAEVVAIVNGTAALQAINVEARTTGGGVRVFSTTPVTGSITIATTAMSTAIGFSPLDSAFGASGFAQDTDEDYENEWNLKAGVSLVVGHEIAKAAFEDFFDSTVAPPYTINAGTNDAFMFDFDALGASSASGTVAAGTYNTVVAMATALQTAFDAATGGANRIIAEEVEDDAGTPVLRIRTAFYTQFRTRAPAASTIWPTLGFTERTLILNNFYFRWLESTVLAAADFDVTPEAYEDYEEEWKSNENSIFSFVGPPTDLEFASFDVGVPEDVEDFEEEWTLTL